MPIFTIPKKALQNDDIVILPRQEYERLYRFWSSAEQITKREKSAIEKGLKEIKNGKFYTSVQVRKELGL